MDQAHHYDDDDDDDDDDVGQTLGWWPLGSIVWGMQVWRAAAAAAVDDVPNSRWQ